MIRSRLGIRSCIGLDIGSSTTKFVEVKRQGRTTSVTGYGMLTTPSNMVLQGRIISEASLEALLAYWVQNHDLRTKNIVLGLNSPEINVNTEKFPYMTENELRKVIEFELPDLAGFVFEPQEEITYSYDTIREGSTQVEILFAACRRNLVDPYVRVIKGLGFELHAIDLQALTWPQLFRESARVCFVDIGAQQMSIYAELDGIYKVYRSLPTGGNEITSGIMDAFECNEAEARQMQEQYDVNHLLTNGQGSRIAIRATFQQVIGGILQTLDFLRAEERASTIGEVIDGVMLLGGTSHLRGLDTMLSQELSVPVTVANPFIEQNLGDGVSLPIDHAAYGSALGLALRGLEG